MNQLSHSWEDIYSYYYLKGLNVFAIESFLNMLVSLIIAFAPIFVFGCVDFEAIKSANCTDAKILSFGEGFSRSNIFIKLCFIFYVTFTFILFAQFLMCLPNLVKMKSFFLGRFENI